MAVVEDYGQPDPNEEANKPLEETKQKEVNILPPNFDLEGKYSVALEGELDADKENIILPSDTNDNVRERLTRVNQKVKDFNSNWLSTFQSSLESVAFDNAFVNTVNRPGSQFSQKLDSSVGPLYMGMAKAKVNPNQKLTGESLRLMIRQDLNLGGTYNVPLWHSGFWVRFKAPAESAILDLYRALTEEKISLGRATYGLIFSNNTSFSSAAMLNFCEDHILSTSLVIPEGESVKKYISVLDIPTVIWGMVCSIWSNGFQYSRACSAEPDKCNHVTHELLDPSKLLWVDKTRLTARQIAHMTKREKGSVTVESLNIYKDEFLNGQPKAIKFNDNLSFVIAIDSAQEHIDSGARWVSNIEETYPNVMIRDEKERDDYLIKQAKATVMRQYTHFVKSMTYMGVEYTNNEKDREDIEAAISDLSASDELRKIFQDEIKKYIDESTVSLIAIPTYKCPSCGKEQREAKDNERMQGLIPIEVMSNFFILAVQKIRRIEQR
jgi:hypothetical protein